MVTHWIILNHWAHWGDQLMEISFNAASCSVFTKYPRQWCPYPPHFAHRGFTQNISSFKDWNCWTLKSDACSRSYFNLNNVYSSCKGKDHHTMAPSVCSVTPFYSNTRWISTFSPGIKKKYVLPVLIKLQSQSNLQIKHQQKGKTIKIQINSIN